MTQRIFESGELDFAYDEDRIEPACVRYAQKHGVYVRVVRDVGSGGGWPVVRLYGEVPNVVRAIREGWQSGDDASDEETVAFALAAGSWIT